MGEIRVLEPGMLSSVQDLGRDGHRHIGVPTSGSFDRRAMRVGNLLVGNPRDAACIEMTMLGGAFEFSEDTVVCLGGARCDGIVFDEPFVVKGGTTLRLGRLRDGIRSYLFVRGGIDTPQVLGSRSSLVSAPDAGLGQSLRTSDVLSIGSCERAGEISTTHLPISTHTNDDAPIVIRVVASLHTELFTEEQRKSLEQLSFVVHDQSNRVGVRLTGNSIGSELPTLVKSEGMLPGFIQVPSSGEPIVLGVDGPTSGGYPVIASVNEADMHLLGQCGPRRAVQLRWLAREEAIEASRVYLGADIGEASTPEGIANERLLLEHVNAASIACSGHTGDANSIRATIQDAIEHGCMIGAHPSYPDRRGFGRRAMEISCADLGDSLRTQLELIKSIADELGTEIRFIKAHGALYHAVASNAEFARWYVGICESIMPSLKHILPIGCDAIETLRRGGVECIAEGFCDRTYEPDGSLRDRTLEGALITDPKIAARQAELLSLRHDCRMLCVHSDTPEAIDIAKQVRASIDSN